MNNRLFKYLSDRLALAFDKATGNMLFLGVESGARGTRHRDVNLLRCGFQGGIFPDERGLAADDIEGDLLLNGEHGSCRIAVEGDSFSLRFSSCNGHLLDGGLFSFAIAPSICPASLWAQPETWEAMESPLAGDPLAPPASTRSYRTPGLITLPEYGMIECRSDQPLRIDHTHRPDPMNAGMNLGFGDLGSHNIRLAMSHGTFEFEFVVVDPVEEVELTFWVRDEAFPQIDGVDVSDAKWNGLKRHWMSHFTLNPASLSLGDNPALGGCGHLAIHWKSDVAVYTPELLQGLRVQVFFRNALETTFGQRTDENGRMTGYGWENGGTNLIALHAYLLATGDWDFVLRHLPTVEKVIAYNLSLDTDGDGILEALYHGNNMKGEKTSLNWWDAFAFGHKDAYGNLVYYQAFRRILPVLRELGADDTADRVGAFLQRFSESFHDTFYNEKTGVCAGWISQDGRVHDYMFTFITAMAINEGLVEDEKAKQMMQTLLQQLEDSGYGEFKYGIPGPAIPCPVEDRVDWPAMGDWGRYEHGGFCGQTAYHFLLALYKCGLRDVADKILFNMLNTFETMPTHSGLQTRFCESVDWRTRDGQPCGYNYLGDNYVFLLAAIQGHFNVPLPDLPARSKQR